MKFLIIFFITFFSIQSVNARYYDYRTSDSDNSHNEFTYKSSNKNNYKAQPKNNNKNNEIYYTDTIYQTKETITEITPVNNKSLELYLGFGIAYNKLKSSKSNSFDFNSTGSQCTGSTTCDPFTGTIDQTLVTSQQINFNNSFNKSSHNYVPTLGLNFNFDNFNLAVEGSYFFNDIEKSTNLNNWYTLPTNPNGINGSSIIISGMGEQVNAALKEKFSELYTVSILPGYDFNQWFSGFVKLGYANMKYESESSLGTRGGAGKLGLSGNYSKRLHGYVWGLGFDINLEDVSFRLEYNRTKFSGFKANSVDKSTTLKRYVSTNNFLATNSAIDYKGNNKVKYGKFENDIIMLSVMKKFNLLDF